ncbi:MAG: hypothetical protein ACR2J5_10245 [Geodermatophilaceae bacterium]
MPGLHIKGYMLQLLAREGAMWDYEVADQVMNAYGLNGDYWYGTVRLTLTDLYAGGLLNELEATIDPAKSLGVEKILFRYQLNEFGRERMQQSGLLEVAR